MSDLEHLRILEQGADVWNQWREDNPKVRPDLHLYKLSDMDLSGYNFNHTDLRVAELDSATLHGSVFSEADLSGANLQDADLTWTNFNGAVLIGADLTNADLSDSMLPCANFGGAKLIGANFSRASLNGVSLVKAEVDGAIFTDSSVYGISVWSLKGTPKDQSNLVITKLDEPTITVDNLEVAQFIYLLLFNHKIREVIDTITSKVVLILGRFTASRKVVLDGIRRELRKEGYVPVLFDFEKPKSRTTIETISTLARMARFVIADITEAKSVLQELQEIVPNTPSVPVQPLLLASDHEPGMFDHFKAYQWVLQPHVYDSQEDLLESLKIKVIIPAEEKLKELGKR